MSFPKAQRVPGTRPAFRPVAVDAAPPWQHNPSSWAQRLPICALAAVTGCVALYMAAYQWRWTATVWDPVFGDQTERVLDSGVSERMRHWLLIPDAALGAIGYLSEAILGLAGSSRRWRERPWLVILFGVDVIPLGIVSAILVVLQGTVVGFWCFLCLFTAVVSLVLILLAYDEVWSSIVYVRDVRRTTNSRRAAWDAFWGRSNIANAREIAPGSTTSSGSLVRSWPRMFEMMLGVWLAVGSWLLPGPHDVRWQLGGLFAGSAIVVCSALSLRASLERSHFANIVIACGLVGFLLVLAPRPASAEAQNQLFTTLLILNFAVVPNERVRRT